MFFDSLQFWAFFAVAFLTLAMLRDQPAKVWLIALSYVFYGAWDWRFCLLLGGSTLANYYFGLAVDAQQGSSRKRILALAVAFNLGLLGVFKYYNFFVTSFAALFGIAPGSMILNIVLPVGISFFTFESIAYATDIYRGKLRAVQSKVDFALFVAFFPHLVAGPVIRPLDFFPQLKHRLQLTQLDVRWGMREILKGLLKKVVFADNFAPIADSYFMGSQTAPGGIPAIAGVLAFAFQIYFDFSGYTDIARGCSRLLGYRFPPNFERPYLSPDIADFWHRWHISLSSWLKDYLYIPLGGSRVSFPRILFNLIIVMGLGGIWHGASWNFLIWGLYHGVLLVTHRLWRRALAAMKLERLSDSKLLRPLWGLTTFVFVTVGWVFFRAKNFTAACNTFQALATGSFDFKFFYTQWGLWLIPFLSLVWCMLDRKRGIQDWLVERASWPIAAASGVLVILLLETFSAIDTNIPFVYFRF
jgi:D-alanyl-lipoteichoic acid acyltransferase DltB (MBOAT superfamily)